jgi:hypothetical protein
MADFTEYFTCRHSSEMASEISRHIDGFIKSDRRGNTIHVVRGETGIQGQNGKLKFWYIWKSHVWTVYNGDESIVLVVTGSIPFEVECYPLNVT